MASIRHRRQPGSALLAALLWAGLCWGLAGGSAVSAQGEGAPSVATALRLGVQPLGYPSGVVSAVMSRDRLLKQALAEVGQGLEIQPFRTGADMVAPLVQGRLDAALLGDMPTLTAASSGPVWVVGLVRQASTALVARGIRRLQELAGKRIGFVEGSSAHYSLLQVLAKAGLREGEVRLIPMRIDDMPQALDQGEIAAFAGWEPAPTIALALSDRNRTLFLAPSRDYFVLGQPFASRAPQAALQLAASLARAVDWLRRSRDHLEQAARWTLADAEAFGAKPSALSVEQLVAITRRDLLNIPSAPVIPRRPDRPPLKDEYQFLALLGRLPADASWDQVAAAFDYDGLARVMTEPRHYRLNRFDYGD